MLNYLYNNTLKWWTWGYRNPVRSQIHDNHYMLIPTRFFVPVKCKTVSLRAYLPASSKHPLEDILVLLSLSFVYDIRADTVNYSLLVKRQKPGRTRRPLQSGERMPHRELHLFLWQLYVIEFLRGRSINLCMRLAIHRYRRNLSRPYCQRTNLSSLNSCTVSLSLRFHAFRRGLPHIEHEQVFVVFLRRTARISKYCLSIIPAARTSPLCLPMRNRCCLSFGCIMSPSAVLATARLWMTSCTPFF